MMFTGLVLGRRFYVGADDADEAVAKVRRAHEIRWGKPAADALDIERVEPWNHIAWAGR